MKKSDYYLEPHFPLTYFFNIIDTVRRYLISYSITCLLMIIFFSFIYSGFLFPYKEAFLQSIDSFFFNSHPQNGVPYSFYTMEIFLKEALIVCFFTTIISRSLFAPCPIGFSEFITHTANRYTLRYWILMRPKTFLLDASVRVMFINKKNFNSGNGKLQSKWETSQNLHMIRGIRSIIIENDNNSNNASDLANLVKTYIGNSDYVIHIVIKGTRLDGRQYYSSKSYPLDRIMEDYTFVSIRKEEIPERIMPVGSSSYNKLPIMNYLHFNLIYRIGNGTGVDYAFWHNKVEHFYNRPQAFLGERCYLKRKTLFKYVSSIYNRLLIAFYQKDRYKMF